MRTDEAAARWHGLTVVPDDDGFVVGDPSVGVFVAVPPVGGSVVRWLQEGFSVTEATAMASDMAGEPVDVQAFVTVLDHAGVLSSGHGSGQWRMPRPASRRIGRAVFNPLGWLLLCGSSLAGVAVLVSEDDLRPTGHDLVMFTSPLTSVLGSSVLAMTCVFLHEWAHLLCTAAEGVPTRLSIGRRLYFLTAQADLSGLWSLPRSRRFGPLLAGMAVDAATVGAMLLIEATGAAPGLAGRVLRCLVALQVAALVFQAAVFMRTDLYAVLLVASRSRNLWTVKSAVLRRAIGRAREGDLALLSHTSPRDRRVAGCFLALYLPGLALATWYLFAVTLPGLGALASLTFEGLSPFDLRAGHTWQSLGVLLVVVTPNVAALIAALTSRLRRRRSQQATL